MQSTVLRVNILTGLLEGGAANAAKQLLAGLQQEGVDVQLLFPSRLDPSKQADGYRGVRWQQPAMARLISAASFRAHRESFKRKVRHRPRGMEIFTSPRGAPFTAWPPVGYQIADDDIIHLHWVAKFIDWSSFFPSLPKRQVVIWTLHDMNPFTGGCHFTDGCERFSSRCGDCPQLPRPSAEDISRSFFQMKRDALRDVNLHVVTASRWMQQQAERSPIFEHVRSYHRIPYGLPMQRCQPVERSVARAELGLDPNAFVFAFGAVDIQNRRKGASLLLEALEHVADIPNAVGLVLGGGHLPETANPTPELRSLGFVKEIERRMFIYSACDLFVLPSIEDNMPLTGLEALASGTPIVGFDSSGVPDFVRPDQTGRLAAPGDAKGMADQIRYFAENRQHAAEMAVRAREVAVAEYSDDREAKDYAALYAALSAEAAGV